MADHWAEQYVGMAYTRHNDCAWAMRHVLKQERGIDVRLPSGIAWNSIPPHRLVEMSREFAVPVPEPRDYDAVLMKIFGHTRDIGSHIGLYAEVEGEAWVLHSIKPLGMVFVPLRQLSRMNLELIGFYRWLDAD